MPDKMHPPAGLKPFTRLGDISIEQFMAEYWQRKPLLVRQAIPHFQSPITAEELAGFALEEDVESRLILERPTVDPLQSEWMTRHGPLQESDFDLPEQNWTLLVQAVDQLVPEVAELLHRFRFLPNWRLDDIMVSYAADRGNVGPHYDHYDVFLLQAEGRRHWRLGQYCDSREPSRSDTQLSLLTRFDTAWQAILEPGDMLYIPPNTAHWGVAEGPCMTYSIGFRAPSHEDILLDYSQDLAADLRPEQRYSDAGAPVPSHPGEITKDAVNRAKEILSQLLMDEQRIAQWLAVYGTEPKRSAGLDQADLANADQHSRCVQLKARVRSAFLPDRVLARLYLNGEPYSCTLNLAQALSSYQPVDTAVFATTEDKALLQDMLEQEWLWSVDTE